jgi:hypothetical protein
MPCTLESFLKQARLSLEDLDDAPQSIPSNSSEQIWFAETDAISIDVSNPSSNSLNAQDCLVSGINSYGPRRGYEIPAGFSISNRWEQEDVKEAFGAPVAEGDDEVEGDHLLTYFIVNNDSGAMYVFGFFEDPEDYDYICFRYGF